MSDCQICPELRFRLSGLRLQLQAVSRRIDAEVEEPTMSRMQLLWMVQQQLEDASDTAAVGV